MKLFKRTEESGDEVKEFAMKELEAVRRRLDGMQKELDTAQELARLNANLANTALSEVATLIQREFRTLREEMQSCFDRLDRNSPE